MTSPSDLPPSELSGRLLVGVITGAQGIRGAVRIKSFTAEPVDVGGYGPLADEAGGRRFDLKIVGQAKGVVIGKLLGIDDRNQAEALKGTRLYIERTQLPPADDDEFYHADLIGLTARHVDGSDLGTVKAVFDFPAGDALEVELDGGGTIFVPFTRATVPQIDLAGRVLLIDPPVGLFEPASPEPNSPEAEESEEAETLAGAES
ncbi:MAG TPA: ribosome maturation factor RimM [Stellaceae bacterium]|nr:ribosome maturation factor RimM [Stellaceae bacterium]